MTAMDADTTAALLRFAESVHSAVEAQSKAIDALIGKVDAELMELREGLVEVDTKVGNLMRDAYHAEMQRLRGERG